MQIKAVFTQEEVDINSVLVIPSFPNSKVKPPYHYYEFVDCCEGWTKLRTANGKYVCRCDGRLYQQARSRQLQCRPTTG